ncbi:hemoglobin subunit alpha-D [Protobothrops mucrosquamatus]|uniref:hemoglobin subunit alpha-D n=1 Tax=Protobothrops mucrosquamatus TaxID=103944 RepID=UPI000775AB5D|nr:hemoglobin subunit alpha-D [Protobothrops mucrosquamatus]
MVLTAEDRRLLQASVGKLGCRLEDIGADALNRLLMVFPKTKTYFSHYNLSPGSKDIIHQGEKVGKALDNALKHLDDLRGALSQLSDLHAYNLRVDPVNFKLLSKCFIVSLATHLRNEYNPCVCLAWAKFLEQVSDVLCEKYR